MRDNKLTSWGKTIDGKSTFRSGASYAFGGFGAEQVAESETRITDHPDKSKITYTLKRSAPGISRVEKWYPFNANGISTSSSQVNLFSFKAAFYYGVDVSVSLNLADLQVIGAERNALVSESTQINMFIPDFPISK